MRIRWTAEAAMQIYRMDCANMPQRDCIRRFRALTSWRKR